MHRTSFYMAKINRDGVRITVRCRFIQRYAEGVYLATGLPVTNPDGTPIVTDRIIEVDAPISPNEVLAAAASYWPESWNGKKISVTYTMPTHGGSNA